MKNLSLKENIRLYRNKKGLTLDEVSSRLGVSKPTLQRYESGVINTVPYDKVQRLAEIFDTSPSELMGWNDFDEKHNVHGEVTREVKAAEEVHACFGEKATRILEDFISLNDMGQNKALDYVSDLSEHEKYRK